MSTIEERARTLKDDCVRILCDLPPNNPEMLQAATGGKVMGGEGNGVDEAKVIARIMTFLLSDDAPKRRGRPRKAKADASAATPRKRKPGRPKGSKNKKPRASAKTETNADEAANSPAPEPETPDATPDAPPSPDENVLVE